VVARHFRGPEVQRRAGLSTLRQLMVERPDEIDRLDDGALAGRLDFDDWIRELADRWTRLGPMGLRADALSLMSGRERGSPPSELEEIFVRLRAAYDEARVDALEQQFRRPDG
jgi:hypothetical protein